jgi:predicted DNA-binding ribbon-helix-helix protein
MTAENEEKRYVGVHLDTDSYNQLKEIAEAEKRPVANLVRACLLELIEAHKNAGAAV